MRRLGLPLALLFIVFAVRLVGVNDFPVWTDEGWTVWATEHLADTLPNIAADRHPPLYFLSLSLWQDVAGMSRVSLRLLSIYSAVLTAAVMWRLAVRVRGARAGVVALLLFAVMPSAVYYTREIRHFGWLMLTVSLSSWLFLRLLHRPTWARYTLYAVSVALVMYTLYMGFFVILIQVIIGFFVWRGRLIDKAKLIGAWALALGLFAPWLYVIIRYQLELMSVGIAGVGNVTSNNPLVLWELMRETLGNGLPLLVVAWILAAVSLWRTSERRTDTAYLWLWGIGAFVLMAIVNNWMTMFRVRTLMMLVPAFILAAAVGVDMLPRRVGAVFAAVLLGLTAYRVLPIQPRIDYPPVAKALAAEYQSGDLIVVETGWDDDAFLYEVRLEVGFDADVIRTLQWVDYRGENKLVVLEVEDRLRAAERIWVIHWNQPTQVASWLQGDHEDFEEVSLQYFPVGAEMEVYADGYFARVDGDIRLYLFAKEAQ